MKLLWKIIVGAHFRRIARDFTVEYNLGSPLGIAEEELHLNA